MVRGNSNFLLINGQPVPCPSADMEIISTINVDAGRNAFGQVIGQVVGRRQWKINNLHWVGLDADQWAYIKSLLEPFYVPVTFTGDDNVRRTLIMYPGDTTGHPLFLDGISYKNYRDCKFNLIDCGL
jgi:hypothetical protein